MYQSLTKSAINLDIGYADKNEQNACNPKIFRHQQARQHDTNNQLHRLNPEDVRSTPGDGTYHIFTDIVILHFNTVY